MLDGNAGLSPLERVAALSATASRQVKDDVVRLLPPRDPPPRPGKNSSYPTLVEMLNVSLFRNGRTSSSLGSSADARNA